MSVYVSTITSGREKYKYETTLVGVFQCKKDAVMATFDVLHKSEKIFSLEDEDDKVDEMLDTKYYQSMVQRNKLCNSIDNCNEMLHNVCTKFSDSYYKDGWHYCIQEQEIKPSLNDFKKST